MSSLLFRLPKADGNMMFGLTSAHAAGAIAMVMVGMRLEVSPGVYLINDDMLNGVVMMILFTCVISTLMTERASKQIVLEEKMYGYKESYSPIFKVLDGYSWHLRVRFSDGTSISSGGSNARPEGDGLKRLENYLNQLIADADSILR